MASPALLRLPLTMGAEEDVAADVEEGAVVDEAITIITIILTEVTELAARRAKMDNFEKLKS
jgi:hypothetical protein